MSADTSDAARTFGRPPEAGSDQHSAAAGPSHAGTPDPDLDGLDVDGATSDLDDLKAELTAELDGTVVIPVEGRPRYAVRYRIDNLDAKVLDGFRKRAKDRSFSDGIDGGKFAGIGLASQCVAILRDGKPLELDGEVQTFTSRAFQDLLGAPSAVPAVVRFYSLPGNLDAAMRKLMEEAGWGDDAVTSDPTT